MIGLGFLISRYQQLESRTLSNLTIYLLTPALIFTKYVHNPIPLPEIFRIILFSVLFFSSMALLTFIVTKILAQNRLLRHSFCLSVILLNSGNMGLPFIIFAFGDAGLSVAIIFLMISIVNTNTLGVFIAAGASSTPLTAAKQIFMLPAIYAIFASIIIQQVHLKIPGVILDPLTLLGEAAIPTSIILLGTQLASSKLGKHSRDTIIATIMRLFVSAGVTFGLTELIYFEPLTRKILILLTSMPSAVYSVILADKFNTRPDFTSSVVFVSTLGSAVSLAVLLYLVG